MLQEWPKQRIHVWGAVSREQWYSPAFSFPPAEAQESAFFLLWVVPSFSSMWTCTQQSLCTACTPQTGTPSYSQLHITTQPATHRHTLQTGTPSYSQLHSQLHTDTHYRLAHHHIASYTSLHSQLYRHTHYRLAHHHIASYTSLHSQLYTDTHTTDWHTII